MENKTVLVIGASGGIGSKVVEMLLAQGYSVIGAYFETNIDQFPSTVTRLQVNLTDVKSIKALFESLKDKKLYAIVNCAGICRYENSDFDNDLEVWNETISVNLTANFLLAKIFKDNLENNGRFIMISSTDSYYGGAITSAYAASKAGVNSLVKSLSLSLSKNNIHVNAIAPGWVDTAMIADNGQDFLVKVANINPLKKIADPKDIAKVIKFLLSSDSDYVNGQVITVDGGYTNQDPTLLLEEEVNS